MAKLEYKDQKNAEDEGRIDALLKDLPPFCRQYNMARGHLSPRTRLTYTERFHVFLSYLHENNSFFASKALSDITLQDLDRLETEDIEEFIDWIRKGNAKSGRSKTRSKETTINNYITSLNSLFSHFVKRRRLEHNPVAVVDRPKKPAREVIRMNDSEEAGLFDSINYGTNLSDGQNKYRNDITIARDYAICLTLVRTGLRVSELIGLNLEDINFKNKFFSVMRKGNKPDTVYFSDAVEAALYEYLELRPLLNPDRDEKAVFLVTIGKYKGTRLSVRSVQLLVKKYGQAGAPTLGKALTPHKFRATYATNMIAVNNGNISLVQTELNHSSPATTSLYIDQRSIDKERHRNDLDD